MAKITLTSSLSFADAFEIFISYKTAQGLTDKTIECYRSHFLCISHYLDTSIQLPNLSKEDLHQMISEMRQANLSPNSIASYTKEDSEY